MNNFANLPATDNANDFNVAEFEGFSSVATFSRAVWDRMDVDEKRKIFKTRHILVKGSRSGAENGQDPWDPRFLASYVDLWSARQCHGKHIVLLSGACLQYT